MHLIIDIRSDERYTLIERYAKQWVDLWLMRHHTDQISYLHLEHQDCPSNGRSLSVGRSRGWWSTKIPIRSKWSTEIFRCVSFSAYPIYDTTISSIRHIWGNGSILYPRTPSSWFARFSWVRDTHTYRGERIIVPSLSVGREVVEIHHIWEESIEIIPYLTLTPIPSDRHILSQLTLPTPYWIYDGSYGSESSIDALIAWYASYRRLGGTHTLVLAWLMTSDEIRYVSYHAHAHEITGSVRIIGAMRAEQLESLYTSASGWIYIGGYYTSGPRLELARSHHLPLLISDIPAFSDYHEWAMVIHPNHLWGLWTLLPDFAKMEPRSYTKVSNDALMQWYERVLAEKR